MILALVETDVQGITEMSQEALTFARGLAERSGEAVEGVVMGDLADGARAVLAEQAGEHGVRAVHHARADGLSAYGGAAWAAAVVHATRFTGADLVVAAGTPRGSEILAHVATRLQTTMAANVVAVDDLDPLVVSRQVMGGSVLEEMRVDARPAVLTVAGHAVDPKPADQPSTPQVEVFDPELTEADLGGRVVRTEVTEGDDVSALTGARVVVGAGRGVGSAGGFDDLLELTELLDGALGVSRVVTSLGWRPHHEQVGQTGSRITPDLYIACGISGAIQHWAGCSSAKTIVAVNTDAEAPMVTKAHYAVIGDLHEIVPAVNAELRERQG